MQMKVTLESIIFIVLYRCPITLSVYRHHIISFSPATSYLFTKPQKFLFSCVLLAADLSSVRRSSENTGNTRPNSARRRFRGAVVADDLSPACEELG
ncbi:hypothetical protein CEXT_238421 [Caerostris extrusa]|uniref:Uncharacterized protein n=1 Tax=Caerostris extrusa TaxID=172846 RepID=A0AAV4T5R8_CAEEX|nr:hypothetical protein CEXT_238421 [Caerostris extrusa]